MTISTNHPGMAPVYQMNQGMTSKLPTEVNEDVEADGNQDKVDLSSEAQELAAGEAQEEGGDTAMLDAAIEKIKEQMEAIKAQLEQLKNVDGEAVVAQKKMLNEQLAILSSQLMELMAKKLEVMG